MDNRPYPHHNFNCAATKALIVLQLQYLWELLPEKLRQAFGDMPATEFHPRNEFARMAIETHQLVQLLCRRFQCSLEDDLYGEIMRFVDRQRTESFFNSYWTIRTVRLFLETHLDSGLRELDTACAMPAIVDAVKFLRQRWLQELSDIRSAALVYTLLRACMVFPGKPQAASAETAAS